jgi:preprotein translocase subunit SecD
MLKRDRWRLLLVVLVVAAALASVFPIQGKIRLGLDLKGGAHILLQAKGTPENPVTEDSVERLLAVLRNRVDQYGVSEPVIQREGRDRIIVDLPGVEDPEAALELIGKTALLEFRAVEGISPRVPASPERKNYEDDASFAAAEERWKEAAEQVAAVQQEMAAKAEGDDALAIMKDEKNVAYLLGPALVTGKDLLDAKTAFDKLGRPVVTIKFNAEGTKLFDKARRTMWDVSSRSLSTELWFPRRWCRENQRRVTRRSPEVSPPRKRSASPSCSGQAHFPFGGNSRKPSVGPTLGSDSIESGLRAGLIGRRWWCSSCCSTTDSSNRCGCGLGCGGSSRLRGTHQLEGDPDASRHRGNRAHHRYGRGWQHPHL